MTSDRGERGHPATRVFNPLPTKIPTIKKRDRHNGPRIFKSNRLLSLDRSRRLN